MNNGKSQKEVNQAHEDKLEAHDKHLKIANEEMGVVQNDIKWLKKEFNEIKSYVKSLNWKIWALLASAVISILIRFV